jgi:O-antigen/teichoic acid export membrane protein
MSGPTQSRTFGAALIHGSAWMIAMRWVLRLTGLVSTAILARLLVPADFGIVAMAAVFAGLLDTAAYTGVDLALIRAGQNTPARMNSAWTIQLIQAWVVALLILGASPLAVAYFGEPRVAIVMQWLAAKSVIEGFQNIGIIEFRRELNFSKEFRFNLYVKVLNLAIVIAAAFYFRNYMALVIGLVSGSVISVLMSYVMHPHRPRWSLAEARHLWSFSNWFLVTGIGSVLSRKADEFIVGGVVGSVALGNYHVATEIATMPTMELVMPMRRALFPTLSTLQQDRTAFRSATLHTFGALAAVCFSLGFGLSATASEVVALVLGPQWQAAVPLVQWLALYGAFAGLASILEVPIWVNGKTNVSAIQSWVELAGLVPLLIVAVRWRGIEGAAMSRVVIAAAVLPMMLWLVSRVCPISFGDLARALWRPLASGIVMTLCLAALPVLEPVVLSLAVKVAVGAMAYVAAMTVLWWLSGRSQGIESVVIERARQLVRKPA